MPIPNTQFMKKLFRGFLFLLAAVLVLFLIATTIVWIKSPGVTPPFEDTQGNTIPQSVAQIIKKPFNGYNQGLVIRGKDTANPVLLQVHGGPGTPDMPFFKYYDAEIEDVFTLCYWDQRGSGSSFSSDLRTESLTLDQIVDDGIAVAEYLRKKLKKNKIWIQGHSWGTCVAAHMVAQRPDLFHAYLSIGSMGDQLLSEQLSYDFVLAEAKKLNDNEAIKELEGIGRPPYDSLPEMLHAVVLERKYVSRYGGAHHAHKDSNEFYKHMILNVPDYSLMDKFGYLNGMEYTAQQLWEFASHLDMAELVPEQQIPVFFIQGAHDYQTTTSVAKAYFDTLKAPIKKYYLFENSAHLPHWENKTRYREVLAEAMQVVAEYEANDCQSAIEEKYLESRFEEVLQSLADMPYKYELLSQEEVEIENTYLINRIRFLNGLKRNYPLVPVQGLKTVKQAKIKGKLSMRSGGGSLYPRAELEEWIFTSKRCMEEALEVLQQIEFREGKFDDVISKSPMTYWVKENKIYFLTPGGFYMLDEGEKLIEELKKRL